jgi:hypothetical protein
MIRAISVFAFVFSFLVFAQLLWKVLTKQEKWEFTKILFCSIIISMVTVAIMFAIVVLF